MARDKRLNPRQEAFARAYIEIGIARHAYAAAGYQAAMPTDPSDPAPVDAAASRLLKQVKVASRIGEIRQAMAKRAEVTEDSLLEELEEARVLALCDKQASAAVSATMGKAKLVGLLVDRQELGSAGEFTSMSEDELRRYIADMSEQVSPLPTASGTDAVN